TSPSSVHEPPPPHTSPLSLHDALPIWLYRPRDHQGDRGGDRLPHASDRARLRATRRHPHCGGPPPGDPVRRRRDRRARGGGGRRSEEHTSELQSRENLVCRLLLEKKKK